MSSLLVTQNRPICNNSDAAKERTGKNYLHEKVRASPKEKTPSSFTPRPQEGA